MTRKVPLTSAAANQKAGAIASTLAMGRAHHAQGFLGLADGCYRQVLTMESNNVEALHLLGVVALQLNKPEEAIRLIKRSARKMPTDPAMFVNLGAAYRKAKQLKQAQEAYETAIKLKPELAEAHFNLGKVLFDLRDADAAISVSKKCIALSPTMAEAHINLGNAYKLKNEPAAALAAYEEAKRLAPNMAEAYGNIAAVVFDIGKHAEALDIMDQAVALQPSPGEQRYKRSLMALRFGQLAKGWADYESRYFAAEETVPRFAAPPPYWNGEDLAEKTLLIWTEQGLGDEILYASMLEDLRKRAPRCIIECSPRMVPVFERSFPWAKVVRYQSQGNRTTPAADFDTQTSIASLGQYFRPDFESFPRHQGHMKAGPERTAALRARYQALASGNLIVGLSWRSKATGLGAAKSADIATWGDILGVKNITFVNLQYGDCAAELAAVKEKLGVEVFQDADVNPMKSMDDFFAQVAAMDLVITTSNTTVHVAGGLNVPTWLLLNSGIGGIWYWFSDRTDSPWYPAVRIFRRPNDGDTSFLNWWRGIIGEVGAALAAKVRERLAGPPG